MQPAKVAFYFCLISNINNLDKIANIATLIINSLTSKRKTNQQAAPSGAALFYSANDLTPLILLKQH